MVTGLRYSGSCILRKKHKLNLVANILGLFSTSRYYLLDLFWASGKGEVLQGKRFTKYAQRCNSHGRLLSAWLSAPPFFFTSNNYSSSSSFFISSLMKVVTNVMLQFKGYASRLLLITRDVTLLYHCLQVLSLSTFSLQKN
jgi:hypothetical protein